MNTASGLTVLVGLLSLSSGQVAPVKEPDPSIRVDVEVVNVLCTVYDERGILAKDLRKEDFQVRENGVPQQIRYFGREMDLPLTLALLIDVSGSVRSVIQEEKHTAARFLDTILRPVDQAMLMGFSSTVVLWQDFTSSPQRLGAALERLRAVPLRGLPVYSRPFAGTLLYDAAYLTADQKLREVQGRKAIVIISDGVDTGSEVNIHGAIEALQSTNTITYGICYEPPNGDSGCSYLKEMSTPTGGRSFKVGKKTSLSRIFQTIEEEIRSQYAIGYVSTNTAHDGAFRKLQVKIRHGRFRVQARKGYYAAEPVGHMVTPASH